jgi:hypothetical protein
MRSGAISAWTLVGAAALGWYASMVAVFLVPLVLDPERGTLSEFNGHVSQAVLVIAAVPSLILAVMLIVRRIARPLMVVAAAWLLLNAFLWIPVYIALTTVAAAGAGLLLLGASRRAP